MIVKNKPSCDRLDVSSNQKLFFFPEKILPTKLKGTFGLKLIY